MGRVIAAIGALTALGLVGCGGGDSADADSTPSATTAATTTTTQTTPPTTSTVTRPAQPTASALPGLTRADVDAIEGYLAWTELGLSSNTTGSGAHPGAKRVFASRVGRPYPKGAVVIKEARTDDVVTLIAIMEKVRSSDESTGGWRYVEYKRDGAGKSFAAVAFPESGCASCHMQANTSGGADWVFSTP